MLLSSLLLPLTLGSGTVLAARETQAESVVHTRELLAYRGMGVGTLMSKYDSTIGEELAGLPIGLQEYYAPYPDSNGDILLLAMPIAKIYRNALPPNPPNMTLTVSDTYGFGDGNLAAGRMRVALFGTLERVTDEKESKKCLEAYLAEHPDARGWVGSGSDPHFSFFARLRVQKVYTFGGFGNVAWIGWHSLESYRDAGAEMRSKKEVLRDWPEPIQPGEFMSSRSLFGDSAMERDRLRIQL